MAKDIKPRQVTVGVGQYLAVGLLAEGEPRDLSGYLLSEDDKVCKIKEGLCYVPGYNAYVRYVGMFNDSFFDLEVCQRNAEGRAENPKINHLPVSRAKLEFMLNPKEDSSESGIKRILSLEIVEVNPLSLTLKCYEAQHLG